MDTDTYEWVLLSQWANYSLAVAYKYNFCQSISSMPQGTFLCNGACNTLKKFLRVQSHGLLNCFINWGQKAICTWEL